MSKEITPVERKALAAKFDLDEQYLYQCLTGRRDMKPADARKLEDDSDGVLTRQMLCQKTWRGIWPELAQSPVGITQAAGQGA
ncbi:MAG: hypothetical protein V4706_01815 [Pseudomonadota bacterium]